MQYLSTQLHIKITAKDRVYVPEERRFCDKCMNRTMHEIVEDPEVIYTYKRRRLYRCKECGKKSMKQGLRPSAESVY